MYAKLSNGMLIPAPHNMICEIETGETKKIFQVFNPTEEQYIEAGYLPVIEEDYPDATDKYYEKVFTERDGAIYAAWIECKVPEMPTPAPTNEERIAAIEEELAAAKILLGVE